MPKIENNENHWTYLGLIDDRVFKYPWNNHDNINEKYFEKILRISALFDDCLLINDGYLVHSDWRINQLADNTSLFRMLMKKKLVTIFSKREDGRIDLMIKDLAENVESFKKLKDDKQWKSKEEQLTDACKGPDYFYTTWPSIKKFDNRIGFDNIINEIEGKNVSGTNLDDIPPDILDNIFKYYRQMRLENPKTGSRTIWEKAIKALPNNYKKKLMQVANEVYHYNLSLAIAATSSANVGVSTIATGQTCASFSATTDPILNFDVNLPKGIELLHPRDFCELIDRIEKEKNKFRSSLHEHKKKPQEKNVKDCLKEYVESIADNFHKGKWYTKDRGVMNATLSLISAMAGVRLTTNQINDIPLQMGIVGLLTLAPWLIGEGCYLVAGWMNRKHYLQKFKNVLSPINRKLDKTLVGTFLIDNKKAEIHLKNSKPRE